MKVLSKPDHGAVIAQVVNGEVKAAILLQTYLDDLQQKINELEDRIIVLESA